MIQELSRYMSSDVKNTSIFDSGTHRLSSQCIKRKSWYEDLHLRDGK